jgi:hypothetical protein
MENDDSPTYVQTEELKPKNVTLGGEILQKMNVLRERESKKLGFQVTHVQMMHYLINYHSTYN